MNMVILAMVEGLSIAFLVIFSLLIVGGLIVSSWLEKKRLRQIDQWRELSRRQQQQSAGLPAGTASDPSPPQERLGWFPRSVSWKFALVFVAVVASVGAAVSVRQWGATEPPVIPPAPEIRKDAPASAGTVLWDRDVASQLWFTDFSNYQGKALGENAELAGFAGPESTASVSISISEIQRTGFDLSLANDLSPEPGVKWDALGVIHPKEPDFSQPPSLRNLPLRP